MTNAALRGAGIGWIDFDFAQTCADAECVGGRWHLIGSSAASRLWHLTAQLTWSHEVARRMALGKPGVGVQDSAKAAGCME